MSISIADVPGVTPILTTFVSGDLKLLPGGQSENVSAPLSVFFLNI